MNRPLGMDDSKFPRIRRFEIHSDPVCALDLSADQSRFMSDAEIRRLRDALNADAADATCKPTEHMSGRASVIEHVRCAADNFNESYWPDFEHMTAAEQDVVWAEVHDAISTCLIALGQRTVARVTTRDLARLAIDVAIQLRGLPEPQCTALRRVSDELQQMSERAGGGGTATLWQVDHVDGDWPWIVDHDSLDDPEFIGPQLGDVTDEQLVEAVRNMLDADPGTFVIRRRAKPGPPWENFLIDGQPVTEGAYHLNSYLAVQDEDVAHRVDALSRYCSWRVVRFARSCSLDELKQVFDVAAAAIDDEQATWNSTTPPLELSSPSPSKRAEPDPPTWTAKPPECDCWWRPKNRGRNTPTSLQYRDERYWTEQSSYSPEQMVYSGENGCRFLPIPGGIPVCPEVTS